LSELPEPPEYAVELNDVVWKPAELACAALEESEFPAIITATQGAGGVNTGDSRHRVLETIRALTPPVCPRLFVEGLSALSA
jgi:hypothetical protein